MGSSFDFKQFRIIQDRSALKVGTDAVLLGAAMSIRGSETNILDIGTGTGVIALMAAQRLGPAEGRRIIGIDLDAPSAEEAAANFAASPWKDMLSARAMSLQDFAATDRGRFDLVFSNPPYYDNSLTNPDPRESTARHTATLSFREICSFCSDALEDDGRMSIILPGESRTDLMRTAASFGLYPFRILSVSTTSSKPVRRIVAEFSRERVTPEEERMTLQSGASRSMEYAALTKDFYLY